MGGGAGWNQSESMSLLFVDFVWVAVREESRFLVVGARDLIRTLMRQNAKEKKISGIQTQDLSLDVRMLYH